jgi:hypothetical protein
MLVFERKGIVRATNRAMKRVLLFVAMLIGNSKNGAGKKFTFHVFYFIKPAN